MGLVTSSQLAAAMTEQARSGGRLVEALVAADVATEDRIVLELSKRLGMDIVDPIRTRIHPQVLALVPRDVAYQHRIVPFARKKEDSIERLFVIVADPFDEAMRDVLEQLVPAGVELCCALAGDSEIAAALDAHYGTDAPESTSSPPPLQSIKGVRFGGSVAEPLSGSVLPSDMLGEEATELAGDDGMAPRARPEPRAADELGDYRLVERIGVSALAETWRATRRGAPDDVVHLRRMLPSLSKNSRSRARFYGAAERLLGVRHDNLLTVLDVGSDDGHDYVVTEATGGVPLARVMNVAADRKIEVPAPVALVILRGVTRALCAAHAEGVVHEHLSPRSVLITATGRAKVFDFGVAAGSLDDRGRYLAPEQTVGADERTDVFRAGLLLYELLAGAPLVDAQVKDPERAAELIRRFRRSLTEHRPGLDPEHERLLVGALRPQPDDRFASAEALLDAIDLQLERARASEDDVAAFVHEVLDATTPEPQPLHDAAEALSSAAAASGRALKKAADEVGPAVKRVEARAVPALENLGERAIDGFETFVAAPTSVKVAAGVGTFVVVVLLTAIVAVSMSQRDTAEAEPGRITIADEEADVVAPPPVVTPPAPVEVLPGVFDEPAPPEHAYAKVHGLELRATAAEDGEVLFWLEVGQLVRVMGSVEEANLVLIPPRGPAGFVPPDQLVSTLPLEALARRVAFEGCEVTRKTTLDDCLYSAKQRHDACLDDCRGRDGTRCKPTCNLAFEACLSACRASDEPKEEPPRRRRRRRRR